MSNQFSSKLHSAPDDEWPAQVRVMVCIGYNPASQRLIRRAAQLARAFQGQLIAVHIQADDSTAPGYRTILEQNMELARSLGALVLIEHGGALAEVLAYVAQQHGVTHIVMGESARSRWAEVQKGSLVRQVLHASHGIDMYIVADPA